jgi:nitrous oxide reductase accessory protein NosL
MKLFSLPFFFGIFFLLGFSGCEKKEPGSVVPMHWDRDMCERCKMAISERKFAVEVIEPKRDKAYKFDDIGCAVLWMEEEKVPWKNEAIIWITDAKSGRWIDAKKAKYTEDAITPMAFGFAAYSDETLPQGKKTYDFDMIVPRIEEIEKRNTAKVKAY